mmetsp:Transcript_48435/g.135315  ORF Transcript_48435/g.135315 Transcript_48435/m.135315 type:complete len:244 (+) Transcript_48435:83-814(+)
MVDMVNGATSLAPAEEPLLPSGQRPRSRALKVLGIAVGVAAGVAVGCAARAGQPEGRIGSTRLMARRAPSLATKEAVRCWNNTGGRCLFFDCFPSRGSTNCESSRCYCTPGYCSGSDGHCYKSENVLVATGFKIRSQLWRDRYLSTSGCDPGHMYLSSEDEGDAARFFLYELPHSSAKEKTYVLGSVGYPDCFWWASQWPGKTLVQNAKPVVFDAGVDNYAFKIERVGDGSYKFGHFMSGSDV